MRETIKRGFLFVCKLLGLFLLARIVTRRKLRILCYHGFAFSDESSFRPRLFMRPETFQLRMQYLANHKYPVLGLQQAYEGLAKGSLPDGAVAITIDDGFFGVFESAWPVLRAHSFPATVYVTSYYAEKHNPVFRLAVQYLFWKTEAKTFDNKGLGLPRSAVLPLGSSQQKEEAMWEIIEFGETQLEEPSRLALGHDLGKRLGVEYQELLSTRALSLMDTQEIRQMAEGGVDIQLHTHRHHLPNDAELVRREIQQNREYLEPLAGKKLQHLCYPSGVWTKQHWPWLEELEIITATTCDPGLNSPETPRLGLRRFLDGENVSQIEFEAEVSGFADFIRSVRSLLGPL